MSDYQGNIIIKNPATPTGPNQNGSAPGVWKLSEALSFIRQGIWPTQGVTGSDPYFNYVSMLLSTTSLGNANNNLFVDSSGAFNPISRNGNTTQGSATPYSANWSNYFDGSGDYLSLANKINFGTGDFTVEGWVYRTANPSIYDGVFSIEGTGGDWNSGATGLAISCDSFHVSGVGAVNYSSTMPLNQWTHIACTRSGSTIRVFLNGSQVASTTSSASLGSTAGKFPIIGGFDTLSGASPRFPLTGYISNLRTVTGTALYTSAFTPPTSNLTAISGTSLLTCQSNRFRDASSNNFTITRNGDVRVTDFAPFSPGSPGITYNQSDITNWSGYFDGTGDYLQLASATPLDLASGDFTVEFWGYPTVKTNVVDAAFGYGSFTLMCYHNGTNWTAEGSNNGSSLQFQISTPVTLGAWQHIAITRSGNTITLYKDGVSAATGSLTGAINTSGKTLRVGDNGNSQFFTGSISNFRIVKGTAVYTSNFTPPTTNLTAISGTSLLTLQNAAFTDNSTNSFVITPNGNVTVTGNSPFNTVGYWSNYFDGSGDWLTIPNNAAFSYGTGDFTMEVWVYKTATSGDRAVVDSYTLGSGGGTFGFLINDTQIVGYQTNVASYTFTYTVPNNSWNHIAFVRTGGNLICYVNGTSIGSQANSTNFVSASTIDIGRNAGSGGSQWIGYLSNLRVVKGTAVYTSNFTVPTTPLTAISGTSLLTCQASRIIDSSTNAFTITRNGDVSVQSFDPFYTATIASNGGSMYFDGTGDYLRSTITPLNIRTAFTIDGWVYLTTVANFVFFSGSTTAGSAGAALYLNEGGGTVYFGDGVANNITFASSSIPTNSWAHIACTFDGTTYRVFINGTSVGSSTTLLSNFTLNGIDIGARLSGVTNYTTGYMSGFRITGGTALYTAAFTPPTSPANPTPATTLLVNGMNAGIYDATAINDMETVGNAQVSTVQSKFGGSSVYFDGSGDYLLTPSNPAYALSGTSFTIEAWVYVTSSSEPYQHVVKTSGASNNLMYIDYSGGSNGVLASQVGGTIASQSGVTLNTWHHLAVVRNGTSVTSYVNGVGGTPQTIDPGSSGSVSLLVGYDGGTSPARYFNGYMDDLRITKGVARYTTSFTPPTQAFPTF